MRNTFGLVKEHHDRSLWSPVIVRLTLLSFALSGCESAGVDEPARSAQPLTSSVDGEARQILSFDGAFREVPPYIATRPADLLNLVADKPDAASGIIEAGGLGTTQRAIDLASRLNPEESVEITVALSELPFDYANLRTGSNELRSQTIANRKAALKPSQSALASRLDGIGAQRIATMWLVNHVNATVKAKDVSVVANWPGVVALGTNEPLGPDKYLFDGYSNRNGMRTAAFLDASYKGQAGGRTGGSMHVAQLEQSDPSVLHDAFKFAPPSPYFRWFDIYNCSGGKLCRILALGGAHACQFRRGRPLGEHRGRPGSGHH